MVQSWDQHKTKQAGGLDTACVTDGLAIFISSPERGVCCSTVLALHFGLGDCRGGFWARCDIGILGCSICACFRDDGGRCSCLSSLGHPIIECWTSTAGRISSRSITVTISGTRSSRNVLDGGGRYGSSNSGSRISRSDISLYRSNVL
jgi:hypothetical protein